MTRHKWKDEVIDRNYPIRCKKCKSLTYITDEDYECQVCGAVMCPDCLTLITDENSTYSK